MDTTDLTLGMGLDTGTSFICYELFSGCCCDHMTETSLDWLLAHTIGAQLSNDGESQGTHIQKKQ